MISFHPIVIIFLGVKWRRYESTTGGEITKFKIHLWKRISMVQKWKKKTLLLYTNPTNPRFKFSRRSINKFQVGGAVESWRTKKNCSKFWVRGLPGLPLLSYIQILELSPEGMRKSQDEVREGSGASAGITIVLLTIFRLEILSTTFQYVNCEFIETCKMWQHSSSCHFAYHLKILFFLVGGASTRKTRNKRSYRVWRCWTKKVTILSERE